MPFFYLKNFINLPKTTYLRQLNWLTSIFQHADNIFLLSFNDKHYLFSCFQKKKKFFINFISSLKPRLCLNSTKQTNRLNCYIESQDIHTLKTEKANKLLNEIWSTSVLSFNYRLYLISIQSASIALPLLKIFPCPPLPHKYNFRLTNYPIITSKQIIIT